MGTAPDGWQTPKTDWANNDAPVAADFNRIEGNSNAIETGDRTVDQTQTPTGHVGTLRQLLDWIANRIKVITGETNWWDAPAATIATIWGKFNATSGHLHSGGANDSPKIPDASLARGVTAPGGTEANRLAVTNSSGRVGDSEKLDGKTLWDIEGVWKPVAVIDSTQAVDIPNATNYRYFRLIGEIQKSSFSLTEGDDECYVELRLNNTRYTIKYGLGIDAAGNIAPVTGDIVKLFVDQRRSLDSFSYIDLTFAQTGTYGLLVSQHGFAYVSDDNPAWRVWHRGILRTKTSVTSLRIASSLEFNVSLKLYGLLV